MSPSPLPVVFPRRLPPAYLNGLRARARNGLEIGPGEVMELVEELERLYAEAVAQVMVDAPIPKVADLLVESQFPLRPTIMKVLAKRLDPALSKAPWVGAAAKSLHTVMGKSEEEVRRHLDEVTR